MKTKTSPGNPRLHFSLFDSSVCLFLQMPFFVSKPNVCVCAHDIKSVMGLSFSPPDRLNPRENTVIGAATPASPASTHTLHEISGRGAVMQGHAWQEGTFISGGESHWYSFFSNLLCLTRQCAKNQTSELWLCMCVYNIRGPQKIKENTPIFQSWCGDVECPFWNVTINTSVKWPKQRRGDVCCPCLPAGAYLCVSFIDVFTFRHECLFQSVCVWLTLQSLCNLVEEVIRSRTPPRH